MTQERLTLSIRVQARVNACLFMRRPRGFVKVLFCEWNASLNHHHSNRLCSTPVDRKKTGFTCTKLIPTHCPPPRKEDDGSFVYVKGKEDSLIKSGEKQWREK